MENEEKNDEKTPQGRDAILNAYKSANPDSQEPDDASLYDFANTRHSELQKQHGELQNKYDNLNGANVRLAELVSKDPKFGATLSMMSGDKPKSFPYAIASVYGKDLSNLEGDDLEEFEKGYQENLSQLANSKKEQEAAMKNIETYNNTLDDFSKENSLSPEQKSEVHNGIMQLAENILMGNISKDLIDMVYKGLNYEKDMKDAANTGYVEGKNTVAEAKMKEKTTPGAVPDFGGASAPGTPLKVPKKKTGSFYDQFKEEKV